MKPVKFLLVSLAVGLVVLFSCGENPVDPNENAAERDFPNSLGYWWKYESVDSIATYIDTISVVVQDEVLLSDGSLTHEWFYRYAHLRCGETRCAYSTYVNVEGRRVTVYQNTDAASASQLIVFPLTVGAKWEEPVLAESTLVAAQEVLAVPYGTFNNAFRIQRTYIGFEGGSTETIWVVPGIGIVQRHIRGSGFELRNESWRLIDFGISAE